MGKNKKIKQRNNDSNNEQSSTRKHKSFFSVLKEIIAPLIVASLTYFLFSCHVDRVALKHANINYEIVIQSYEYPNVLSAYDEKEKNEVYLSGMPIKFVLKKDRNSGEAMAFHVAYFLNDDLRVTEMKNELFYYADSELLDRDKMIAEMSKSVEQNKEQFGCKDEVYCLFVSFDPQEKYHILHIALEGYNGDFEIHSLVFVEVDRIVETMPEGYSGMYAYKVIVLSETGLYDSKMIAEMENEFLDKGLVLHILQVIEMEREIIKEKIG